MVKLLLIAHNHIGQEILKTAREIIGKDTCNAFVLSIFHNQSYDEQLKKAKEIINSVKDKQNLVIMTDLKGATPYNIAVEASDNAIPIICGLSLAKVIQLYNYCSLPLDKIIEKLESSNL